MRRVCCISYPKGIGGRRGIHPREQGQRQIQIISPHHLNQQSPVTLTVTTSPSTTKTVHNHQHHNQNHQHPNPNPNPTNNNTNRE